MKFLLKNKLNIILFIIGLCIGLILMSFNIKKINIPTKDGENSILSFDNGAISSDEYYNKLKDLSGIEILLDLIDEKILNEKYQLTDKEIKNIKYEIEENINNYKKYYNISEQEFLNNNGFKDKESLLSYLILEKKRYLYEKDYLKNKISNNEINNYYLSKMEKDFEIMYIKGDNKILEEILIGLNNGKTYDDIIKKYKNIKYENLGYISFDNTINKDIYDDALNLSENGYTKSIRSINDEYYIIFKGKVKDKDEIENLKERIKNKIIEEKIENDNDKALYKEALINLRTENNIEFYDTYLNNLYNKYKKQ